MPKAYRRSKARVGLGWAWERPFKGLSPKEAETSKNRLRLIYGTIIEKRSEEVQEMMEKRASKRPSKGLRRLRLCHKSYRDNLAGIRRTACGGELKKYGYAVPREGSGIAVIWTVVINDVHRSRNTRSRHRSRCDRGLPDGNRPEPVLFRRWFPCGNHHRHLRG